MCSTNKSSQTMDLPNGNRLIFETNDEGINYKTENRFNKSFASLNEMQNQEMLCDITIEADHIEVRAHKVILAASSLFFYTLFSNSFGSTTNRIVLDDIHCDALLMIIQYIYTAELFVNNENVKYLLRAAKLLVLDDVFNACCHFLQAQLNVDNCLRIAAFARENDCLDLISQADAFIEEHFSQLVSTEDFLELSHQRVTEIVKSDKLNVPDELKVFEAIVAWVKYEIQNRRDYFASLLEFVRFPLIPQRDLIEKVSAEPLFQTSANYILFMNEAMRYHLMLADDQKSNLSTPRTKLRMMADFSEVSTSTFVTIPQSPVQKKEFLLVVGEKYVSGEWSMGMEIYDFENQQWMPGPKSFNKCQGLITIFAEEKIYTVNSKNRLVDVFDLTSRKWSECCELIQCRDEGAAAAVLNGDIYFSGGYKRLHHQIINYIKSCEKFDKDTGRWVIKASMNEERYNHRMCSVGEKIYAIGGKNQVDERLSSVECYTPETDSWHSLPNMTFKRSQPGVAELDGKLYVLGGWNEARNLKSVEVYDPVLNRWFRSADFTVQRSQFGVAVNDGLLYVVGGDADNSVEVYDSRNDNWSILPIRMNNINKSFNAAIINNWPF